MWRGRVVLVGAMNWWNWSGAPSNMFVLCWSSALLPLPFSDGKINHHNAISKYS